ncbi:exopolyphosphatase [Aggregatibacter actinomycetemcomitans]|uniref:exopolyphosphatase n=1 Tax=Aggregatibacter actinomycetemcomitans TaxID=714 RepID=UPI00022ABEA3|nr:exopolyphosphatase [Aggregatibacter actinomycetemcomitans]KOE70184.1 exopolyphosphatase [Aggregatibacter actinomycetemcomitans serotype f str. D18P1]KYK89267.1 exopolyphosphatase [Aggregatibacter actinomycetemcomitans serotype f str. SC29R]MBN6061308.1 exopolyphosphatase [Aggregatibacter actinomycetemcomitans]OZV15367.1 exopolyphosphatase [Aggregatibacter actinomycetemcomitans]UEL53790.1 exopolyphosphatase [Aggregatibacter actinomycetemcomitans]
MNNENLLKKANELYARRGEVREIAAIDLGSNSFHMIIARIVNGTLQVLSRLKQKVQLAEGLDENQVLSQAAIERGVNCLALFAERLQGFSAENVSVVGTYTLRRAVNNDVFLRQAANVFPYQINIISGKTEAKTIYAGVCHTQPETGRKFVIDIGGGSTEMIIGDNFTPLIYESRHVGCVSFAKKFFPNGEISAENFRQAKQSALNKIEDLAWEYRNLGWQSVLGSSGTIKTVHQVIYENIDPNGTITAPRLDQLIEQTLQHSHFNQLKFNGLNPDRADVFVPGLAILSAVFENFHIEKMRYSDGALREGVMYSLEQNFQVNNIRERTALGLAEQFNIDQAQAERVYQSAALLFNQYNAWQNTELIPEMQDVLFWAARLHEVGIVINHKAMQKHSAYILYNTELPGFDNEQHRLLSTLVRYHIGNFKLPDMFKFSRYNEKDVLALIRILRLAAIINRSRQATEKTEKIILKNDRTFSNWQLEFETDYLTHNPLLKNDLALENRFLQTLELSLSAR